MPAVDKALGWGQARGLELQLHILYLFLNCVPSHSPVYFQTACISAYV